MRDALPEPYAHPICRCNVTAANGGISRRPALGTSAAWAAAPWAVGRLTYAARQHKLPAAALSPVWGHQHEVGGWSKMISSIRAGLAGYLRQEQARYGTLFVLPTFFFFCVFIAWPVGYSFYLGFFDWSPLEP